MISKKAILSVQLSNTEREEAERKKKELHESARAIAKDETLMIGSVNMIGAVKIFFANERTFVLFAGTAFPTWEEMKCFVLALFGNNRHDKHSMNVGFIVENLASWVHSKEMKSTFINTMSMFSRMMTFISANDCYKIGARLSDWALKCLMEKQSGTKGVITTSAFLNTVLSSSIPLANEVYLLTLQKKSEERTKTLKSYVPQILSCMNDLKSTLESFHYFKVRHVSGMGLDAVYEHVKVPFHERMIGA